MGRNEVVGLAEAAAQLRLPYQDAHRLLLIGRLKGEKLRGRWFLRVLEVEKLARELEKEGLRRGGLARGPRSG